MNAVQKQSFGEFVRCAVTAVSNGSLYSGDHPQVIRLCQKAIYHLQESMEGQAELSFMGIDGAIVCEGDRIDDNLFMNRFAQTLKTKGVEHVEIQRGITCQELQAFITSLLKKKGGSPATIATPHIRLGKIDVAMTQSAASTLRSKAEKEGLLDVPMAELDLLKEIFNDVKRQRVLRVVGIQEIVAALVESVRQEAVPLAALIPLRDLDEYTFSHSLNVCILNLSQAMAMGIEGQSLHDIGIAALLHDVGKLFIPEEVLNKPGKLNEEEWALMRQHPLKGAQYLMEISGTPRLAVVTAFEHHMKFNHTGYPTISADWKQNLCSQMTTVSDFFDALHTHRSYRSSLDIEEIRVLMHERSGQEFNPALMKNFFKILKEFTPEVI
jgi:HD-GYP domain-containing protein (c-di-GMP phosphodiesterase class II)